MNVSSTTLNGYINQYSSPSFRNYNYQYQVELLDILATAKVDLVRWKNWMPYLVAGIGLANYSTSQYQEAATSGVTPRVSPGYGSYSGNNFSYQVGVGLDYVLQENVWINVEYNYSDFGTVRTGNGANTPSLTDSNYSNEYLSNKITSNAVFLGATFYIG